MSDSPSNVVSMTEPEQVLEDKLVAQLVDQGYTKVAVTDEASMLANLKAQLEAFNGVTLTSGEFTKVLHHLNKSAGVFNKAHILRDRMKLDKEDGETVYLEFFDSADPLRNRYQVTQQVKMEGSYKNRYDVTILVNGLPLVQIELKRRGLEMKEAFNQIQRYQKHSFWSGHGLFHFVQLFVISNGVNTKYYANARRQSFKQTFYWASEDNTTIRELTPFADAFLNRTHLGTMIGKYIVLNETDKILMVLRPYQYYATEADLGKVAAALAFLVQRECPLSPNVPAIPEQNTRRDEHRGDRPTRALTEPEASRYVHMSQSYLRQSRMDGDRENRTPGPRFLKIGRSVRYLVDDLDAWLEQFRLDNR